MVGNMPACEGFIQRAGNHLVVDGEPVFLNGINLAWVNWGSDWDSDEAISFCAIESALRFIIQKGGNAIRLWVFSEPNRLITKDLDGQILGAHYRVLHNLQAILELATHYGIRVVLTLFNGALVRAKEDCALFGNEDRVSALATRVVGPLAAALKGYESLAMWEVANELGGILDTTQAAGHTFCTDIAAAAVRCPGVVNAGSWNEACRLPVQQLQRFVNVIAATIKQADPNHLVTLGAWSFCVSSEIHYGPTRTKNLWADECLRQAGGMRNGTIDVRTARPCCSQPLNACFPSFPQHCELSRSLVPDSALSSICQVWQLHTYPKQAGGVHFQTGSPAVTPASAYNLVGPVIIGEWSNRWVEKPHGAAWASPTANVTMAELGAGAVRHGYAGAFSWAYTCLTQYDGGCVTRDALAEGLGAAAVELHFGRQRPVPPYSRIMGIQCDKCGRVCRQRFQGYLPPRRCRNEASTRPPSRPPAPVPLPPPRSHTLPPPGAPSPSTPTPPVPCNPSPTHPRPVAVQPLPRAPEAAVAYLPASWSDHVRPPPSIDHWSYTMPWPSGDVASPVQAASPQTPGDPHSWASL